MLPPQCPPGGLHVSQAYQVLANPNSLESHRGAQSPLREGDQAAPGRGQHECAISTPFKSYDDCPRHLPFSQRTWTSPHPLPTVSLGGEGQSQAWQATAPEEVQEPAELLLLPTPNTHPRGPYNYAHIQTVH